MARKKNNMKDRHDIFDRYKDSTSMEQSYNTIETIAQLQHDSWQYFKKDSKPFKRWHKACIALWRLINDASYSTHVKKKKTSDLLEQFICEFEHVERRFRQLLDKKSIPEAERQNFKNITDSRLNSIFRFAIYALLLESRNKRENVQSVTKTTSISLGKDGTEDTYVSNDDRP